MIEIVKKAFTDGFKQRYDNIFEQFYPAHGSAGFTEANLTVNFAEALRAELGTGSFAWFEAPLLDKKNHIDGVVFSKEHNAVFFIESMRIGSGDVSKKREELIANMLLLLKDTERNHVLKEWKVDSFGKALLKQYIVCIADTWAETTDAAINNPEWWLSSDKGSLEAELRRNSTETTFDSILKDRFSFFHDKYFINIAVFWVL